MLCAWQPNSTEMGEAYLCALGVAVGVARPMTLAA
jgi:hypothetical protein